jgi:bifunctional UDP-N-acetylglucosamine pyrophosphorylase/glucosamine-1-phosphate N-acetyltransferase
MQTLVLATTPADRMGPLSTVAPTAMLPVGDRPLLAHVADAAVGAGATELDIVVQSPDSPVIDYFGTTHRDIPVEYAVLGEDTEESATRTADSTAAINSAATLLAEQSGPFAVLDGHCLYDRHDLRTLFDRAPATGYTLAEPTDASTPIRFSDGVVNAVGDDFDGQNGDGLDEQNGDDFDGESGDSFDERNSQSVTHADTPNTIWTGAATFPEKARHFEQSVDLTTLLTRVAREWAVDGVEFDRWQAVRYPWDLLEATEWALDGLSAKIAGKVNEYAEIRGDVRVEPGATIDSGVVIEGPALIRSGATVGPNAYVRGATVIGEDASVGHAVEIKNSVLMPGASANHLSYVGDSVLGPDVNLGAGTTVANLRHDDGDVQAGTERRSTGRRKFGAVFGPSVKTGIDTSVYPGTMLPAESWTLPGENVRSEK